MRRARWLALALAGCGGKAILDREAPASGGGATTGSSMSAGGSAGGGGSGGVAPDLCRACAAATPTAAGGLVNPAIDEASGLAASRRHAGVFYLINDSGGAAALYVTDLTGADLGSYALTATNVDWEDLAAGPCDASGEGACIYVGDIGDNLGSRTSYTIYRAREPDAVAPGEHTLAADAFEFVYADGSHDSEALIVDAATAELFVITKVRGGPSGVYRLPPFGQAQPAERLGEVTPSTGIARITAASAHARGVLVRTYTNLFLYANGATIAERLSAPGCAVAVAAEAQGETVEWLPDGSGYVTVSEGVGSPIHQLVCGP